MHSILIITLVSTFACSAAAFAFDSYRKNGASRITSWDSDEPEPNFHVVLQQIGKTVLRPGGSEATKTVQEMANIQAGDTVLELSAGLGKSSIELAQRYGAKVTLTDIDTFRLEKASDRVSKLGLSSLIEVKQVDMFDIAGALGPDAKYDVAQTEASLTHFPRSRKAAFLNGVATHTDKFILHEVCFKTNDTKVQEQTKKDMSKVLNIGFIPETTENWQKLLVDAGFTTIDFVSSGDLALLEPMRLIKDEGLMGFAKIAYNVITQPYLLKRMLATRGMISSHSGDLGYVTIVASKK